MPKSFFFFFFFLLLFLKNTFITKGRVLPSPFLMPMLILGKPLMSVLYVLPGLYLRIYIHITYINMGPYYTAPGAFVLITCLRDPNTLAQRDLLHSKECRVMVCVWGGCVCVRARSHCHGDVHPGNFSIKTSASFENSHAA